MRKSSKGGRNLPASVRQRLLDLARKQSEDFQYVLTRYGLERLLYRISKSPHGSQFVLKGAVLFQLWSGTPHRPTRDIDLLGRGTPSPESYATTFRTICEHPIQDDDGLTFDTDHLRAEQIKEEDEYQGIRIRLDAYLEAARIPLQIDVGFGDAITPGTIQVEYPTLLGQPAPQLKAYPRETVIAEKFQAMVMLGMANSRMKDFFDLWMLAETFNFEGVILADALKATFARRTTPLPRVAPIALTEKFFGDKQKERQWFAFLTKGRLMQRQISLADVVHTLEPFLMPPVQGLVTNESFGHHWKAGGPWAT